MARLMDNLRRGSALHEVEDAEDGFVIVPKDGAHVQFDQLAREVVAGAGMDYVAFPTTDRHNPTSYDRVLIIPFDGIGPAS
ncbi:MAG: hypothetical protein Q8S03_13460 [Brevundimonas sp.]|uniref:hypothetical protein n=1 Tax=Brevundimonas sp. TaxID=1871086 RepID=UPI00273453EA|nr:hypothetical protein [Brevundimonas sp.]MDP3405698.1 hypothetical protein [Brevundimonas sp.]